MSLPQLEENLAASLDGGHIGIHVAERRAINDLGMTVRNSGADPTGVVDASAAFNTAAEAARVAGGKLVAKGTFRINSTVTIACDADLSAATFNYYGTGTAIRVGDPASQLHRKTVVCPQVVAMLKTGNGWTPVAGSIGVQVSNAYACSVTFPLVRSFETGVMVTGVPTGSSQGTQQCTFYPLHLDNNKVNFAVRPFIGATQALSGWSNQNTVIGGRMSHNSNEGTQVAGVRQVEIADSQYVINGWAFYGTSLESPNVVESHIDCQGQYNTFTDCRFENTGGDASRIIRSRGVARGNAIRRGTNSGQVTQVVDVGARPFDLDTDVHLHRRGGNLTESTVLLENPVSVNGPVLTIMGTGAAVAGSDPTTAWCVRATSTQWAGKRSTDSDARLIMDFTNGRCYVGDGTAAPVGYLGGSATAVFVGGGVSFLPLTDAAQDLGNSGLKWRDLRLSRGLGAFGTTPPTAKPTVTGSRSSGAAVASLLTALASYGLITDSSTA